MSTAFHYDNWLQLRLSISIPSLRRCSVVLWREIRKPLVIDNPCFSLFQYIRYFMCFTNALVSINECLLQIAPSKKVDFIHFKFTHDGKTRRSATCNWGIYIITILINSGSHFIAMTSISSDQWNRKWIRSWELRRHFYIGMVRQFCLDTYSMPTWKRFSDEESLIVLECDDDMCAAIDFAERWATSFYATPNSLKNNSEVRNRPASSLKRRCKK